MQRPPPPRGGGGGGAHWGPVYVKRNTTKKIKARVKHPRRRFETFSPYVSPQIEFFFFSLLKPPPFPGGSSELCCLAVVARIKKTSFELVLLQHFSLGGFETLWGGGGSA